MEITHIKDEDELIDFVTRKHSENKRKTVVQFSAPWCQRCPTASKIMEDMYNDENYSFNFAKVNTSEERDIIESYEITKLPAVIIFSNIQDYKVHQNLDPDNLKSIIQLETSQFNTTEDF